MPLYKEPLEEHTTLLRKYQATHPLESEIINWKEDVYPFRNFTAELTQAWIEAGFNKKETRKWLEIGLQPNEFGLAWWLKINKKVDAEWVLKEGDEEQLKKEYKKFLEETKDGFKLSLEVINSTKRFYHYDLTSEQQLMIDQLIPNKELNKKHASYGLCQECWQLNTGDDWCQSCKSRVY